MTQSSKQSPKPNAWKLSGLANVCCAIWMEAHYQQFTQTMLAEADTDEAIERWVEHLGIFTEEHRRRHFDMLRMMSP